MNKKLIATVLAFGLISAAAFASGGQDDNAPANESFPGRGQGFGRGPGSEQRRMMGDRAPAERSEGEEVSVAGVLGMADSVPVIRSGDDVWVLPAGPFYRLAWENGIKEGDAIAVKGISYEVAEDCPLEGVTGMLVPESVTVNGKELDLSELAPRGPRNGRGRMQRR